MRSQVIWCHFERRHRTINPCKPDTFMAAAGDSSVTARSSKKLSLGAKRGSLLTMWEIATASKKRWLRNDNWIRKAERWGCGVTQNDSVIKLAAISDSWWE